MNHSLLYGTRGVWGMWQQGNVWKRTIFSSIISGLITNLALVGMVMTAISTEFASAHSPYGPGRILVQPVDGVTDTDLNQILSQHGGKSHGKLRSLKVHSVSVPVGAEEKIAAALSRHPKIKFAELDQEVELHPDMGTDDTYYSSEWHLAKIGAPDVWNMVTGSGVIVAILDTGVNSSHPDLAPRIVAGYNTFDNSYDTSDIHGHGTMVAGTVAAVGNNAMGVAGVAWNARIMPMRISDLSGNITYYSIVANALTWATDNGARVANISYGVTQSATVQTAAQYMQSKGGMVVSSAGNSGTVLSEANASSILTVSATDANDVLAGWSSTGPMVDVSAPGVGIWTTTRAGGYGAASGTSFSSPITAGVIALMMSAKPGLSPQKIESILKTTAVDLGTSGPDQQYGAGRVNAAAAVAAAKAEVVAAPSPTPSPTPVPVVDTMPPSILSLVPTESSVVKGNVSVKATASDNVGVVSMKLYIDGVLSAAASSGSISMSWNTKKVSAGAHTIRVEARDAAGNLAAKSVQVSK